MLTPGKSPRPIAITPEIESMLSRNAAVAFGVSGGKDGKACALATIEHLDRIGHTGPRLLIHAHLGSVEWQGTTEKCQELADLLGLELVVVERKAGGLMERWQRRWENNVQRYVDLACVKLILPWSTPKMRFCTSELKSAVIASYLKKRFKGQEIINVTGIRREESAGRRRAAVSEVSTRLSQGKILGMDWRPALDFTKAEVFQLAATYGIEQHFAYTQYNMSRLSCIYCVMSSESDLHAAASCPANHPIYRTMVGLEVASSFAFQGNRWLGDVAPHLLDEHLTTALAKAKVAAQRRQIAEARIPTSLQFDGKGWPSRVPTLAEAELLAEVRLEVGEAIGLQVGYTTAAAVIERYENLLDKRIATTPAERVQLLIPAAGEQLNMGF